ncbi:MAG: nitroreductase family protein [Chloroflexota bacterium]
MDANPGQLVEFLRSLRSVRRFAPRPVPRPVLLDILRVAQWTGSAKNVQPWHIVVTADPEKLAGLAECGPFAGHLKGARATMVLVMDSARSTFDTGRLAQNVMLGAWAHGVGSCIGSFYPEPNQERARTLLGVPADRFVGTAISLGYPRNSEALRVSSWPEGRTVLPSIGRKDLSELASWEAFGQEMPRS